MISSLAKDIKDFLGPKFGAILVKHGKIWLKGSIKSRHARKWNYCNQICGGWTGWNFKIRGLLP